MNTTNAQMLKKIKKGKFIPPCFTSFSLLPFTNNQEISKISPSPSSGKRGKNGMGELRERENTMS